MGTKPRIQPTSVDEANVIRTVLSGLACGTELVEIADRLHAFHPTHHNFPGETLLELASDAIDHSGASRQHPLEFGDIRERFMPELNLTKKHDHYKSKWAIRAAAMVQGGVDPGLDEELAHWHQDDLWQWAFDAVVVYVRAAAERLDVGVAAVAEALATRHRVSLTTNASGEQLRPTWLSHQ